jgi:hypothetical protein
VITLRQIVVQENSRSDVLQETWNNHFKEEVFAHFKSKRLQSIVIIGTLAMPAH